MGESLSDKIAKILGRKIESSHLTRKLKGERPVTEEEETAVNEVLDRESPFYHWKEDCLEAEKENRKLKKKLKVTGIGPRWVAVWLTILFIWWSFLFSHYYAGPFLDYLAQTRADSNIAEICEVRAENATLKAEREVMNARMTELVEIIEGLQKKIEGMDGTPDETKGANDDLFEAEKDTK
jgi:hypothetical protein